MEKREELSEDAVDIEIYNVQNLHGSKLSDAD